MFLPPGRLPGCAQAHVKEVPVTCGVVGSAEDAVAAVSPAAGPGVLAMCPALPCASEPREPRSTPCAEQRPGTLGLLGDRKAVGQECAVIFPPRV